jgi:alanine dehydrogenase
MGLPPAIVCRWIDLSRIAANQPTVVHGEDGDLGVEGAVAVDPVLAKGPSTAGVVLVREPVAEAHGLPYTDPKNIFDRTAFR